MQESMIDRAEEFSAALEGFFSLFDCMGSGSPAGEILPEYVSDMGRVLIEHYKVAVLEPVKRIHKEVGKISIYEDGGLSVTLAHSGLRVCNEHQI